MWHIRFSECLRELGFTPCKAEPDIWLRPTINRHGKEVYGYVVVYVDDLMMAMRDPNAFPATLMNKYGFKLKGTGPIKFHLGMDFARGRPKRIGDTEADQDLKSTDKDTDNYESDMLVASSGSYLERMLAEYERHFGSGPKTYVSPLELGDHLQWQK